MKLKSAPPKTARFPSNRDSLRTPTSSSYEEEELERGGGADWMSSSPPSRLTSAPPTPRLEHCTKAQPATTIVPLFAATAPCRGATWSSNLSRRSVRAPPWLTPDHRRYERNGSRQARLVCIALNVPFHAVSAGASSLTSAPSSMERELTPLSTGIKTWPPAPLSGGDDCPRVGEAHLEDHLPPIPAT